jgi:hypothetical protein
MLTTACVETDAWAAWIMKSNPGVDGRKAWLALVAYYDGYSELKQQMG